MCVFSLHLSVLTIEKDIDISYSMACLLYALRFKPNKKKFPVSFSAHCSFFTFITFKKIMIKKSIVEIITIIAKFHSYTKILVYLHLFHHKIHTDLHSKTIFLRFKNVTKNIKYVTNFNDI